MTCLVGDPEIHRNLHFAIPIPSMYGLFTYIWLIFKGRCISEYAIHRFYGIVILGGGASQGIIICDYLLLNLIFRESTKTCWFLTLTCRWRK